MDTTQFETETYRHAYTDTDTHIYSDADHTDADRDTLTQM